MLPALRELDMILPDGRLTSGPQMNIWRLTRMLAAATMAVMLMGVMHNVYPVEAAQDAEELFDKTKDAFKAGTAMSAEVTLANYHLVAMQYHSKQISIGSYCESAKPLLQRLAKELTDKEKLNLDRKEVAATAARIGTGGRNCRFGIASVEDLIYRDPPGPAGQSLEEAEARTKGVAERYKQGKATDDDVALAEYDLLEFRYWDGKVSKEDYCASAIPSLVALAQKVDDAAQSGKKSLLDRIMAKRRLYQAKGVCSSA
jgi:hypothetical protein